MATIFHSQNIFLSMPIFISEIIISIIFPILLSYKLVDLKCIFIVIVLL